MGQQVKVYRELQLLNAGIITTNQDMVIIDDELVSKKTQTAVTGASTLTITAAQLITGVLDSNPSENSTYTLPTATQLVARIANCKVGSSFFFVVNNISAFIVTIAASGSGGNDDGTLTVAAGVIRSFLIIITGISSAAYYVYGIE